MIESIFDKVARLNLDLRSTVILIQAEVEYHVNQIMLKKFRTDSFESQRMNSKIIALYDTGIIDGTLRQDLIQIARIRHMFAHNLTVKETEFVAMLKKIKRKKDSGSTPRAKFLAAVKHSYELIKEKNAGM